MNDREIEQAAIALIRWFQSQGIVPVDAFRIMRRLSDKMLKQLLELRPPANWVRK